MKYHTCKDRTVTDQIYPSDDKSERDAAYKEINYIKRIYHKTCLVCPLYKDERQMPEGPEKTEQHGFPEPVHVLSYRILAISLPAYFLDYGCQKDRN